MAGWKTLKETTRGGRGAGLSPKLLVDVTIPKVPDTGKRTIGVVKDILTSAAYHSRGIKVRLDDRRIGRVQGVPPDGQHK